MDTAWQHLTAAQLNERAAAGAVVLLPVASTEQHGPHMATGVDCVLVAEVCRRAAARLTGLGRPVVVAPVLWAGLAQHHMAFGGSFTLRLATYQALLTDLGHSIREAGFRRLVVVNGHGGNMTALNAMSAELTRDIGIDLCITTYFQLAEAAIAPLLEDQPGVLHACEAETSMMLAVRPDLVDLGRLAQAQGPMAARAGAALNAPLHRWRSFADITATGVIGDALSATPEKGERLLEAAADALALALAQDDDPPTPPDS
jgi:creatinine amidohydrolase